MRTICSDLEVFNTQPVEHSGADMVQRGLRSIAASVGRVADFVVEHPHGLDGIVEPTRAIAEKLEELSDAVSDAREAGGQLKTAAQETERMNGWVADRFSSSEGNQSVPVSNAWGKVVSSFSEL